jgi:hypothetical protein
MRIVGTGAALGVTSPLIDDRELGIVAKRVREK